MAETKPIVQDITFAAVQQGIAVLFASLVLDGGVLLSAVLYASGFFWLIVAIIMARRFHAPTRSDLFFIRLGLIPLLTICVIGFYSIWMIKGDI